jgi:ubiquinone/menaquinone biosynthesis C-methylase UbiE
MIRQAALLVALAIALPYVLNQVRRPTRWVGRFFLWTMNMSHSALTDWGLEHVEIQSDFAILDVGCGGGRTIQKLAEVATEGRVSGIDYSVGSVEAARSRNAAMIHAGRVEIQQAPVSRIPFPDATFDLVTAVETHYYWPDLPRDLQEVLRVVKPGGAAVVIAETYKGGKFDLLQRPAMKLLRTTLLSADEHREWFASAGFVEVQVFEERSHGWICVTGRRPV